jgi:hypothetical protein
MVQRLSDCSTGFSSLDSIPVAIPVVRVGFLNGSRDLGALDGCPDMIESTERLPQTDMRIGTRGSVVIDVCLIGGLYLLTGLFIHPIGDFPLNDESSYGTTVRQLLETGDFRPLPWSVAPSLTHVLWGALFCLPTGFSFTALRLATLTAATLGLLGTYVLVRDAGRPAWLALHTALWLGLDPLYLELSYTFMTDVPFTAALIWSAVFYARALKTGTAFETTVGTLLAMAATLSRQLASGLGDPGFGGTRGVDRGAGSFAHPRARIPGGREREFCRRTVPAFHHCVR